jgi:two-component system KDP operon response regulator KdpE
METRVSNKILVIDDDPRFIRMVEKVLSHQGYEALIASSGQEGLKLLFNHRPDLVLLDVVMPKMDGWQTCERIRDISDVPVIILTGNRVNEDDLAYGLDRGADDYLIKPVGNKELIARVRATLRRAALGPAQRIRESITYNDDYLTVDIAKRRVMINGKRIKLSPREFRLFSLLIENAGQILTHQQLLEKVWGWEYTDDIDYVRIYISHLRRKIEPEPSEPKYIMTETGIGYYFQKAT